MGNYFTLSITVLLFFCPFGKTEAKKRLLLHSDLDIIQELAKVNQKLDQQQHQIENLTTALTEKDNASQKNTMKLDEQQHQIENLTKALTEKDNASQKNTMKLDDQQHKIENLTKALTEKDDASQKNTMKLDDQQHKIENLTKALTEKDSASQKNTMILEEQQHQIQNLTNLLTSRDTVIESLKKTLSDQTHKDSGSTYVRWGRTTCAHNDTELVYHGYMGGSAYTTTGGGTNYLCLTADPQWNYYDESIKSEATIRGVEYEFYTQRGDGAAKYFGQNLYNDDAVCAVCKSPRNANVMIPGRMECYSGWTKEYSGYLVSNLDSGAHETEFICLDERPEAVVGGKNDDNEGLMYFVEAACGKSLECPPYVNGRELTCVVCSK